MLLDLQWGSSLKTYCKLKVWCYMHFIPLTYHISRLSRARRKHAQNTHAGLQLGRHSACHLNTSCPAPLLTATRRNRWEVFRHNRIQKRKLQYPKNAAATAHPRGLVVAPCGCMPGWAPQTIALPSTRREHHTVRRYLEKDQNSKYKEWLLLSVDSFCTIVCQKKNLSWTIIN